MSEGARRACMHAHTYVLSHSYTRTHRCGRNQQRDASCTYKHKHKHTHTLSLSLTHTHTQVRIEGMSKGMRQARAVGLTFSNTLPLSKTPPLSNTLTLPPPAPRTTHSATTSHSTTPTKLTTAVDIVGKVAQGSGGEGGGRGGGGGRYVYVKLSDLGRGAAQELFQVLDDLFDSENQRGAPLPEVRAYTHGHAHERACAHTRTL